MAGTSSEPVDLVERFYAAFNSESLDDFVATLHPEVELQTARGPRVGREEARRWATRSPAGALEQRIVVERVRGDDHGAHAVALIRKQWWWREGDQPEAAGEDGGVAGGESRPAHEELGAALFTFRDGLIARWQPFADRDEALASLGR